MLSKSDLENVKPVDSLKFAGAKSTTVDFQIADTDRYLRIEAHAPGVFRLQFGPMARLSPEKPSARVARHAEMLLARPEPVSEMQVSSLLAAQGGAWSIEQGDVTLEIDAQANWSLSKGSTLLVVSGAPASQQGQVADETVWRLGLELDEGDALYGLGETAASFDRRGEQVVSDLPAHRALPLVWSPDGWGMYVNTLGRVVHDLGHSQHDLYSIQVHDDICDIFVFAGDPAEILSQYTALTGRAGQPGLWPMGVWLDQAPGQTPEALAAVAQDLREHGFSFDAVRLTGAAPYGFQADKPGFEWDSALVADAKKLLGRFAQLNAPLAVPTFPGVLAGTPLFEEWEDRGWLLLNDEDSTAHAFPGIEVTGGRPFGLLDLTHKDVYKAWSERQRQVFDEGVGAPVCDAWFDIPDGITARGGEAGAQLRLVYPQLARRALFDAVAGHKTPQEGVVFSRDLFPAAQRFAWQSAPAVSNDWQGMQQGLRSALSVGAAGIPVQMQTLGNAAAPADAVTPELYVRWLAQCVFSANFSFQALPALLPQAFDADTQALVRHWLQWRYRLIPYVLGIIEDAVRTGLPVQRAMALAFPDDVVAHEFDTQYMLGPALLVAPATGPGRTITVYLPEGSGWWDISTGWRYEGGTVLEVDAGLDTLPVFGREGQMLCLGPVVSHTAEFNSARLLDEVWLFGMPEQSPAVMRNKIRVMQMQGSSYIKGLEGLKILPSEGLEVKRRGAEVRISRMR